MKPKTFYSNGKLLLTGEYAILDGAKGLAVPTKFGQSLKVKSSASGLLGWKSLDEKGKVWFETSFQLPNLKLHNASDSDMATKLFKILKGAKTLNPNFLVDAMGHEIETALGFPLNWGLGSSSTLINNIAQWAKIDAHQLLWNSFGGSGYDISCAQHDTPILYQLDLARPIVEIVDFNPSFKNRLYFIHMNKKQDSGQAIANYRKRLFNKAELIATVNSITERMLHANRIELFESLMIEHEMLLSKVLGTETVKQKFPDYFGAIKSLGAWGGDFIMATGNEKTPDYFKAKGFDVIFTFDEMVLKHT